MTRPKKIVSGGQTGADTAALRAGRILGLPTGGWMPRSFRNELGSKWYYAQMYGMQEHADPRYGPRTRQNILDADLTLVFGDLLSPGSRLAFQVAAALEKPIVENPTVEFLTARDWTGLTVNIAGNRESRNHGLEAYVVHLLVAVWGTPEQLARCPLPKVLPRMRGRMRP